MRRVLAKTPALFPDYPLATMTKANLPGTAPEPVSLLGYHRQLAPTAAVKVSPLCLGAMGFGTAWAEVMGPCDREASFALMDYFYSQGGNFIDTYVSFVVFKSNLT